MITESLEQSLFGCFIRNPNIFKENRHLFNTDSFFSNSSKKLLEIFDDWVENVDNLKNAEFPEFKFFLELKYQSWFDINKDFIKKSVALVPDKDVANEKWNYYINTLDKVGFSTKYKNYLLKQVSEIDKDPFRINSLLQQNTLDINKFYADALTYNSKFSLTEVLNDFYKDFFERLTDNFEPSKTMLDNVDNIIDGFYPYSYILLTARSSVGKSAFAGTIVKNMVTIQGKKIAVFNLETNNKDFLRRWFSKELKIDSKLLKNPKLMSPAQREALAKASKQLEADHKNNLFLIDNVYYIEDIIKEIIYIYNTYGLDGVVIDLLGYVKSKETQDTRQQQIAHISNNFFLATRQYPFFVLLIQQENKTGDAQSAQSSGRESEDPYMQSDMAISLRKIINDNQQVDQSKRFIQIMKNRDGEVGNTYVKFIGEYTLFESSLLNGELSE